MTVSTNRSAGFTLLEVVVAVAILGIGVAVALQAFSGGMNSLHRISVAHQAMEDAETVMSEVLSDESIQGPYHDSGDLHDNFYYEVNVDYWQDPDDSGLSVNDPEKKLFLLSVSVDVHYKGNERGRTYRAVCLKTVSEQSLDEFSGQQTLRNLFGGRR